MTGYQDVQFWWNLALIGHLTLTHDVKKKLLFIITLNLEWDYNKFNSNQMEDQIGTILHWSNQKEPKQAKSKHEVIRRNLDRIHISAATPLTSNQSKHNLIQINK